MTDEITAIDQEITRLKEKINTVQGQETEVYSRIVGYYRSVRNWNLGKQGEYKDRVTFSRLTGREIREELSEPSREASTDEISDNSTFWSYSFFYRNTCPNCPPMKEALEGVELTSRSFNVDTEAGMEEASALSIFSAPTVVFFDKNGSELYRTGNPKEVNELFQKSAAIA